MAGGSDSSSTSVHLAVSLDTDHGVFKGAKEVRKRDSEVRMRCRVRRAQWRMCVVGRGKFATCSDKLCWWRQVEQPVTDSIDVVLF